MHRHLLVRSRALANYANVLVLELQMEVLGSYDKRVKGLLWVCGRPRRPTRNEKGSQDGPNQEFPHALSFMFMKASP
jgi:hypothetical protein